MNPSSLAMMTGHHFEAHYSNGLFGMRELAYGGIEYSTSALPLNAGCSVDWFGFDLYREITSKITIAGVVGENGAIGGSINFNHLSVAGYGTSLSAGIDISAMFWLDDHCMTGISLLNCNRAHIGKSGDKLPLILLTGISSMITENIAFGCVLMKDEYYTPSISIGSSIRLINCLELRCGFQTEPARYFAGFSVIWNRLSADYALSTHRPLGLTHLMGCSWSMPK